MNMRQKLQMKFAAVVILGIAASLLAYPEIFVKFPRIYDFFSRPQINLGLDLQGGIHLEYSADVSQVESGKTGEAMQAVQDVIERRVNAFGVAEPVVYTTRSGSDQRLIVELAGVRDINEAKSMIQETPFLEFKELAPEEDSSQSQGLGGDLGWAKKGQFVPEFDKALFDPALSDGMVYSQLVETKFGWHIIKKIESRGEGDKSEVHGAHILFAKAENLVAGSSMPQEVIDSMNEQAQKTAREVLDKALSGDNFADLANEYSQDPGNKPQKEPKFISTGLSGKNLKNAQVEFQNQGLAEPQVGLQFDDEGTKLFAEITKRNLKKQVAIYLDNEIISAPTVQAEITNGQAVISGKFSTDEANKLVKRLNEGALPVPIKLVGQQSVEATLGQASLEKSLKAGIIGLVLVVIFMLVYYRFLGLIASVALLIYAAIMISIFKLSEFSPWQITLTLPGIAGFILTIGMAVDANILIFERTKEEIKKGRNILSAVEEGFKRAWTSIRDGNMSSIITAFILAEMGTGFVKGFAVTLIIGVGVSMFTAVVITRTILRFVLGSWIEDKMWLVGAKNEEEKKLDVKIK
jgi:protein-export membrane protein SecD